MAELATLYFTHDELTALLLCVRSTMLQLPDNVMLNSLDTALTETIWSLESPRVTPTRNESPVTLESIRRAFEPGR